MFPGSYRPTLAHFFIALLAKKQLLLRNFTQNIDTLERVAAVPPEFLVEAHGAGASQEGSRFFSDRSLFLQVRLVVLIAFRVVRQCRSIL
jgi:hypothetical protein